MKNSNEKKSTEETKKNADETKKSETKSQEPSIGVEPTADSGGGNDGPGVIVD